MSKIKVRKRTTVLRFSLILEKFTSDILSFILDIENSQKSYSFGNKSSSLSFNQKLNLLIDAKHISKSDKFKLESIASVRNQFMHNINANNFIDAINNIDGLENKLKKIYPNNFNKDLENGLQKSIVDLFNDGLLILLDYKGAITNKIELKSKGDTYERLFKKFNESFHHGFKEFEDTIQKLDKNLIDKDVLLESLKLLKIEIVKNALADPD